MITPGPVVITVGFIGYVVSAEGYGFGAGLAGASVAALATFLPCYLLTIIPALTSKSMANVLVLSLSSTGLRPQQLEQSLELVWSWGVGPCFENGWTPEIPRFSFC